MIETVLYVTGAIQLSVFDPVWVWLDEATNSERCYMVGVGNRRLRGRPTAAFLGMTRRNGEEEPGPIVVALVRIAELTVARPGHSSVPRRTTPSARVMIRDVVESGYVAARLGSPFMRESPRRARAATCLVSPSPSEGLIERTGVMATADCTSWSAVSSRRPCPGVPPGRTSDGCSVRSPGPLR